MRAHGRRPRSRLHPHPPCPASQATGQQKGLAITSFVAGGTVTGMPARGRRHSRHHLRSSSAGAGPGGSPGQYGGASFALAGLILGYVSFLIPLVILPAMLLPTLSQAKGKAQSIKCANNMKIDRPRV